MLGYIRGEEAGKARADTAWRDVATHCVATATDVNDTLTQCMTALTARKRCVCFEEPPKLQPTEL